MGEKMQFITWIKNYQQYVSIQKEIEITAHHFLQLTVKLVEGLQLTLKPTFPEEYSKNQIKIAQAKLNKLI